MKDVKYFAPTKVDEALMLLAEHGENVTVLAGGTDLVSKINYYELKPDILVYVGGLTSDYINEKDGKLSISALTPTATIANSSLIADKAGALSEAAKRSGTFAIRNSATIGGNLSNASPAADLATPLLVMDAELILASTEGKRVISVNDFFVGPGQTVLKSNELLMEIQVPPVSGKSVFLKLGRRKSMTLSVVNVAVRIDLEGGKCREARIALGSMAPTPIRCQNAEEMLIGKYIDKALIDQCADEAISACNPIDDQRATAWYRRKAGTALVNRALAQASGIDIT